MTVIAPNFNDQHFRHVVGRFPSGVTIITTETAQGAPLGLTISSFHSLSLEPPLVLWTLTKAASSLAHFLTSTRYVVHILGAEQQGLAQRFARGPQAERFQDVALKRAPGQTLMLDDTRSAAWLECYNLTQHEAGDHYIFVGQVERCAYQTIAPLIYHAGGFELTRNEATPEPHHNNAIPL